MNRILGCAGLVALLALPLSINANAQDNQTTPSAPPPQYVQNPPNHSRWDNNHGTIGVYGDLFRVSPSGGSAVNFLGLGGRVGFNVHPNIALEAEMNYDFEKNYTAINTGSNSGSVSSTTVSSRTRPLTALFGPKFQFGTSGPFRAFVTG
jgi:hypothetical protein